ncbi:hypothetical protein [Streptomyces sp. NPDC006739]|uniref:hypothetical protein n=1 Tax=Streptomyces sp. NPDC006739 TaxID=3364763 RepID=UPI0036C1A0F4
MSQSAPPPQQSAQAQQPAQAPQPFPAQQQPAGPPGLPPYAQPGSVPPPVAPPAPPRNNLVLGLIAAVAAALVAAALYGVVIGVTKHEIGWAAVGVGLVIGVAAGKAGGRNPALAITAVVLALGSVYLGQLVGEAMIGAKETGLSFAQVFFDHFDVVQKAWKDEADPLTFVFFGIAGYAAFSGTSKAAR